MRRKDREIPREAAEAVIDSCAFAVLSMVNADGSPYGVPLSLVRDADALYFHAALEGQKTENLRARPRVSVSFVGKTRVPEHAFTVEYESAIVSGEAAEVTDEAEKIHALRLLCLRYAPANMENFDAALRKSLAKTAVWKIRIDHITGKRS